MTDRQPMYDIIDFLMFLNTLNGLYDDYGSMRDATIEQTQEVIANINALQEKEPYFGEKEMANPYIKMILEGADATGDIFKQEHSADILKHAEEILRHNK